MQWNDFRQSDNVEDRRGGESEGGGGFSGRGGGLGFGGMIIVGLIAWATGINPAILFTGAEILSNVTRGSSEVPTKGMTGKPADDMGRFMSGVLGSTEDQWNKIFATSGRDYKETSLVLYTRGTRSGCGSASSAMGPFYCPNDQKVYLDTAFFKELEQRFRGCSGKGCQFASAYVLAHEIGHHVQNQMGILTKVQQMQGAMGQREGNAMQVRVELQADCFAGVWAHHANKDRPFIEPGDVEAALQTASAIGDDTLQRKSQGQVVPDSFTHGSAQQRQRWFAIGLQQGNVAACNTFNAQQL